MKPNPPTEDLFKETTMSFGEHLDELRVRLIRGVLGLAVGVLIGLYFGTNMVEFIQEPFVDSLRHYYKLQAVKEYETWMTRKRAQGLTPPNDLAEVRHMVMDRELLWQEFNIQPWQMHSALRQTYGSQVPALAFTGPREFRESDFVSPLELAEAVRGWNAIDKESKEPTNPAGYRLWEALPEETQQAIESAEDDEQAKQALLGLNSLLTKEGLYDAAAFAETPAYGESLALVAEGDDLTALGLSRLNRLLVENVVANPMLMQTTQPQLVQLLAWRPLAEDDRIKLRTFNAQEAFMIYIKAALVLGAIIGGPFFIYQVWLFVAAGLFPHEKHYVHVFLPFSIILFVSGALFCYFLVIGIVLDFLLSVNTWMGLNPEPRISEWLGFVLFLPLGFGIAFQLPLVMLFLQRIGVMSKELYIKKWRIAFLAIAVIAMILTPADPASMMLMAVPLWVLYFGGIGLCMWMPATRNPYREAV